MLLKKLSEFNFNVYSRPIEVFRNWVFNETQQLIEGYKQKWRISFYWKAHTVSLIGRLIDILLVECDLHNGYSLFVPLA